MRVVVALMTCLAIGVLCCPSSAGRAVSMLSEGVGTAFGSDGPASVPEVWVERWLGSGWLLVREPRVAYSRSTVLPVYLGLDLSISPGSTLRLNGLLYTASGRRALLASQAAVYVDARWGRPVAPFPDAALAAAWTSFQEIDLQSCRVATIDPPTPPSWDDGEPGQAVQRTAQEGSVADAKLSGGENITLTDKLVIAAYDPDCSVASQFFYIIDRNQRYSIGGIKVVPRSPVVVKPRDRVTVVGNVVPSGTNVAECYIDATAVTVGVEEDIPPSPGMTNRSTAGGEFGAQQALYANTQQMGSGLSAVGSLVRVWGRIDRVRIEDDHVTYWLNDGSNLERTGPAGTQAGLRVVAWVDSATPSPYLADQVSFVGVVGAELSGGLPVPVVRVGRKQVKDIFFVDGVGGQDSNNGSSWALAKRTVQAAIDVASEDDEVWVKAGTYHKRANDQNVALLKDGVSLYGGFAGTETDRWLRNPASYRTILDGTVNEAPAVVVVKLDGQTVTSRVDSLTVQNGLSNGDHGGGGMQCWDSPAVVCNNVFRWNAASSEHGGGINCSDSACFIVFNDISDNPGTNRQGNGGGVCATGYPSAYIADNVISNNDVYEGAGVYVSQSEPMLRDNLIEENHAQYGGGVYVNQGGGTLWRNTISRNEATLASGGGIYAYQGTTPLRVIDNTIEENVAEDAGGALCFYQTGLELAGNVISGNTSTGGGGAVLSYGASATIRGNTFSGNASDMSSGGALALNQVSGSITQNEFSGNTCFTDGGAISCGGTSNLEITRNTFTGNGGGDRGGALSITDATGVEVINNLFVGNHVTGTGGGAVYAYASWLSSTSVDVVNNTFVENWATNSPGESNGWGGAVLAETFDQTTAAEVALVNNIFYNNTARDAYSGNSVACRPWNVTMSVLFCAAFSNVSDQVAYQYLDVTPGLGCYCSLLQGSDPQMFTNGYHLAYPGGPSYSPVNLGHNWDATNYPLVPFNDLDGLSRPCGVVTDMGCYEVQQ